MNASPTKLRNGSWGARVRSASVHAGDTIQITSRSGKTWTATVARVLWSGEGVSICATSDRDQPRQSARSYQQECCGYPCPVTGRRCTPGDPCHDCQ